MIAERSGGIEMLPAFTNGNLRFASSPSEHPVEAGYFTEPF
jgi:hypothetical protein